MKQSAVSMPQALAFRQYLRLLILIPLVLFTVQMLAPTQPTLAQGEEDGVSAAESTTTVYLNYVPLFVVPPLSSPFDMTLFMIGDGRLYEVWHSNNSQARHQTQQENGYFYHTKGNEISAEWERLQATGSYIYRSIDTSPGNEEYYVVYDDQGQVGVPWIPQIWNVGETYYERVNVVFYRKSDCAVVNAGYLDSYIRFLDYYPSYTFGSGDSAITLGNVIHLAWLLDPNAQPTETYFYAENFGLVAWTSSTNGASYISEIHAPGQRPDNTRETIGCMSQTLQPLALDLGVPLSPLSPADAARVGFRGSSDAIHIELDK